jgi:hypothetical protein
MLPMLAKHPNLLRMSKLEDRELPLADLRWEEGLEDGWKTKIMPTTTHVRVSGDSVENVIYWNVWFFSLIDTPGVKMRKQLGGT